MSIRVVVSVSLQIADRAIRQERQENTVNIYLARIARSLLDTLAAMSKHHRSVDNIIRHNAW